MAKLSRRSFLSGAAAAAVTSSVSMPRAHAACAKGPHAGASSEAGKSFTPRACPVPQPPKATLRAPEPEHLDVELRTLLDIRRRLERGTLKLPPLTRAAREVRFGGLRTPSHRFPALPVGGAAYDASLAAGPEHLIATGNYSVAVYAKSGDAPLPPCDLRGWFPTAPAGVDAFDPRALYDQHEHRWIVLALAKDGPIPPTSSSLLLSVSRSADPLGEWWSWIFDAQLDGTVATGLWADYPCVGVDDRALYVTMNMRDKVRPRYAKLRVFPKSELYAGRVATFTDFVELTNPVVSDPSQALAFSIQPCHTYGAPGVEYLANTLTFGHVLTLWRVTGSPGDPQLACDPVEVDDYLYPPALAPQMGEPMALGIGPSGVRSAVHRDGSVWVAFATGYGPGPNNPALTSARWYEIANGKTVRLGEVAARRAHYCFPAVMPNRNREVTLVASGSSGNEFPSLYYGVWGPTGGGAVGVLKQGEGPHLKCRQLRPCDKPGAANGWGDYNTAALDPTDETTVWLYGSAGAKNDRTTWATWIASVP